MNLDRVNLSPTVSDEVKTTTCYMCACRCGIRVHLKDGALRYIEGNRDHPVNRGVLCAKGSAGIMQHTSPARLSKPLKRVGPRGSGQFEPIEWEDALALATEWLGKVRASDPKRLAFFTGRDQSQALTGCGPASSARPTTPPTAASARSTWRRPACTPSADRSGSSASRTGSTRATS
jgi:anaerobic selenocysteine-containing dehydrogenase